MLILGLLSQRVFAWRLCEISTLALERLLGNTSVQVYLSQEFLTPGLFTHSLHSGKNIWGTFFFFKIVFIFRNCTVWQHFHLSPSWFYLFAYLFIFSQPPPPCSVYCCPSISFFYYFAHPSSAVCSKTYCALDSVYLLFFFSYAIRNTHTVILSVPLNWCSVYFFIISQQENLITCFLMMPTK